MKRRSWSHDLSSDGLSSAFHIVSCAPPSKVMASEVELDGVGFCGMSGILFPDHRPPHPYVFSPLVNRLGWRAGSGGRPARPSWQDWPFRGPSGSGAVNSSVLAWPGHRWNDPKGGMSLPKPCANLLIDIYINWVSSSGSGYDLCHRDVVITLIYHFVWMITL